MSNNRQQSKKIYYRQTKDWIEVSDEYYQFHNKERDLFRDKMRKRCECGCPNNKRWLCDMDCLSCEYQKSGKWQSLDEPLKEHDNLTLADVIPDNSPTTDEIIMDRILLEKLQKVLKSLDSETFKICKFIMEGCSEREIARRLNMNLDTFQRHWKKTKNKIKEKI